jgi:hypothetical protein
VEVGYMANKSRVPMQVSPEFEMRIKKLQAEIMKKQGMVVSLRDLTEKITKVPDFENLEKAILNVRKEDIKLNLDRRKK